MDTEPSVGCPFRIDPAAQDIHAESTRLRAEGPAVRVELPGGVTAWSVVDASLAERLLTDPRVSKDAHQHWPAYMSGDIPEDWPLRIWVDVRNALTAYGPEHTRLRRLIGAGFTARRIRALAPAVEAVVAEVLDALEVLAATESGPVDLREHFARVLPLRVVNIVLGVPEEMHEAFRTTIGGLFATDLTPEEAVANYAAVYRNLTDLVETRRHKPGKDVTSELIRAKDDETGTSLSQQELLDSLMLLIGAGHETTVNLFDHAVANLLGHPDQLDLLVRGEADWADAVEETVRHQAPLASILMRFPVSDIVDEPTGLTFHEGDPIVINYAGINRDPAVHGPDAARFDINRPTRRDHLAFGFGAHFCLGAELGRLEARIALPELFRRFPDMSLAVPVGDLEPQESFISNGHRALPVHLGRRSVAAGGARVR